MRKQRFYRTILVLCLFVYVYLCLRIFGISLFHCPLRTLTGIPCPSCGVTTGIMALIHGDFVKSLRCNPLAIIMFIGFLYIQISILTDLLFNKRIFLRSYLFLCRCFKHKEFIIFCSTCVVLLWGYKIVEGLSTHSIRIPDIVTILRAYIPFLHYFL